MVITGFNLVLSSNLILLVAFLWISITVNLKFCIPQCLKCRAFGIFFRSVVISERCWFALILMQLLVSLTYWSLHFIHVIKYTTFTAWQVVCPRRRGVDLPVVVLFIFWVNWPYLWQKTHLESVLHSQNLRLCAKWILRFLLFWKERPHIFHFVSGGLGMSVCLCCWEEWGVKLVAWFERLGLGGGNRLLVSICVPWDFSIVCMLSWLRLAENILASGWCVKDALILLNNLVELGRAGLYVTTRGTLLLLGLSGFVHSASSPNRFLPLLI